MNNIKNSKSNKKWKKCSRCGSKYNEPSAISRKDGTTNICSKCANEEALLDYMIENEYDIPRID